MADPAELSVRLHEALEAGGIPHAIGGAIAYGFHAEPRATIDIDLNLFVGEDGLDRALEALRGAGVELDAGEARRRAADRGDFVGRLEGYRVDAFIAFHPFHNEVRDRVRQGKLLGTEIPILSAEDLILFKVLFDRPKDWLDIENLLAVGGRDEPYLKRWVGTLLPERDSRRGRLEDLLGRRRAT